MIGYYVHHHGRGHLSRACAIAAALNEPVTGLSSLPRPAGWDGPWIQLPFDDLDAEAHSEAESEADPRTGGHLHWVPLRSSGLRERMALVSAWIDETVPVAVVVDVSVEVALLVRLHGVPVITVALPGRRDDPVHTLGYGVSSAIIAAWPERASGMLIADAPVRAVGAISRFAPVDTEPAPNAVPAPRDGIRRVLVLGGSGGDDITRAAVDRARAQTPGWEWRHLGGAEGEWSGDPWPQILAADVVVAHAGQNALAEVAAARRPAIVIPQKRPFDEQITTATALAGGSWPAIVRPHFPSDGWSQLLEAAAAQDGSAWRRWNDGEGARRAASVVHEVAQAVASRPRVDA